MSPEDLPLPQTWTDGPDALINRLELDNHAASAVRDVFARAEGSMRPDPQNEPILAPWLRQVAAVAERSNISSIQVTERLFSDTNSWGAFSAFGVQISQVFSAYRDAELRNDLEQVRGQRRGDSAHLSPEEFATTYGAPPWTRLNELLLVFGLNYSVPPPSDDVNQPVQFSLQRLDNGITIGPNQLSSGERVLLQLALSLFPYDKMRVGIEMPKVLLLDEMDASLHPEMLNRWLGAIREGLVGQQGVACIVTTHSPTTVALAPEESLFELTLGGGAPRKVSKQHALNRLTFGVPTLSIDFESRRQVFVESDTDAGSYETIAALLKGCLDLPRTLSFLSTGTRASGSETNTGCVIVRKLVTELSESGNKSVFGILDWDTVNDPDERIVVIGHGTHYALDNLLLDPLLVGALLLKDKDAIDGFSGRYNSLGSASAEDLQHLVNAIEAKVTYPDASLETVATPYLGGKILQVRRQHQTMNGHDLEAALIQAHPPLQRYTSGGKRGALTGNVVRRILMDYPDFCPVPIADALRNLATAELS